MDGLCRQVTARAISDRTVWVGGLPACIGGDDELASCFRQRFGDDVVACTMRRKSPEAGSPAVAGRSWGFVTFTSAELAQACADAGPHLDLPVEQIDGGSVAVLVELARPVEELDDPKTDRLAATWIEHRTVVRAQIAGPEPTALQISQASPRRHMIPARAGEPQVLFCYSARLCKPRHETS